MCSDSDKMERKDPKDTNLDTCKTGEVEALWSQAIDVSSYHS
jgi:hypothetical protein